MNKLFKTAVAAVAILVVACNRVPDGVIKPEAMARLMADIRVAEAVVNVNGSDYRNRATREALRKAVMERHGVTEAEFDSSLVWYGHNLGRYQDVTDRSIEILEERLEIAGSKATAAAMSVAGDSVDVWEKPRIYTFNEKSPTRYLTFSMETDRNWESGDVYTWRARFVVPPEKAEWAITAHYDDGAVEMLQSTVKSSAPGKQEITFFTDSTRRADYISGWMLIEQSGHRPVVLDSVSLVRRRKFAPVGGRRSQRKIIPKVEYADSTSRN